MSKGSIPRQVNAKVFGDNFDRIFRSAKPASQDAGASCPKCGLHWPEPCQQTRCIERHGECIKCRFVPSGANNVHGSASGTAQELEQL